VITTANAIARLLTGAKDLSIEDVDRRGNEALVRAAERAGVGRFVFLSIGGLSPSMAARAPLAAAKAQTEELLRASSMRSVVVRPAAFQEVWLSPSTGIQPAKRLALIYGHGRTPCAYVAVDDVAEAVVRLTLADDPPTEFDFGGPQRLTRHEVVDAFERATGAKFRRVTVPRGAMVAGSRLLRRRNPAIASVMGMSLAMDTTEVPFDDRPLKELGIEPRSTTDAIEQMVRR
jgi:NADH dehydrogenase